MRVGLGPDHIVLDGDPALSPFPQKGGHSPSHTFQPMSIVAKRRDSSGTEVGLGQGDVVLDGDPVPLKGAQPRLSAHVYCGQTAGWIMMPLGTEVDLGPGHIVLHGNPAPPQ